MEKLGLKHSAISSFEQIKIRAPAKRVRVKKGMVVIIRLDSPWPAYPTKPSKQTYAENKYRFNGGDELQNKEFSDGSGLELYDAHARSFDPQLGRFWQIDSMSDKNNQETLTPYQFGTDDPSRYNDPSGKMPQLRDRCNYRRRC